MDETLKKQLEITACKVRLGILEGVFNAKSGHPGGSLSIADLLTYLYFAKIQRFAVGLMLRRKRLDKPAPHKQSVFIPRVAHIHSP